MGAWAGTWPTVRLALRRDRVLAPMWVGFFVLFVFASVLGTKDLYPDEASRVAAAQVMNAQPAAVAMYGPVVDPTSLGEISMIKATVTYAAFVAVLGMLLVRRHTRVEEETGRAELVGAAAVGRLAPLGAGLVVAVMVVVSVGLLAGLAASLAGLPPGGSALFGLSWVGAGLVGAGVGALTAQLSANPRTCGLAGGAVVLVAFLVRALGDVRESALSWLSFLHWGTALHAWSDSPRPLVLGLYVVLAAILLGGAVLLAARRDLGAGLIAERPGPVHGRMSSVFGLTLRLHRGSLAGWSVLALVMGLVLGALVTSMGSLLNSAVARAALERLGGRGELEQVVLAALAGIVALMVTGFAVSVVAHTGTEESTGRVEQVLATATSRTQTYAAVGAVALGGALWLLLLAGAGVALGLVGPDPGLAARALPALLVQWPAVAVVTGLSLLGMGIGRGLWWTGWAWLGAFVTLGEVGPMLGLDSRVLDLSPYRHVPRVPTEGWATWSLLGLVALSASLILAGWFAHQRRDIG